MKTYSYKAIAPKEEEGIQGKIEFRTNDEELYERVNHYIHTLIDAEQWRRSIHETKLWEPKERL